MKLMAFIIFTSSILNLTHAQITNPDNVYNAASQTANALVSTVFKKSNTSNDISGRCEFKGSGCNGASVILLKGEKQIYSMTLTNGDFKIPMLKNNEVYVLKLIWPKHKVSESMDAKTGQFVDFNLTPR